MNNLITMDKAIDILYWKYESGEITERQHDKLMSKVQQIFSYSKKRK